MQAKDFLKEIANQITIYDSSEASEIASWVAEHFYGISRNDLLLNKSIDIETKVDLKDIIQRINAAEPIQYIIGEAFFYGLKFQVDTSVLIPRPETEELVELVLKHAVKTDSPQILDIGTGSGCIAVSLAKKKPKASVSAWDISSSALAIAQKNAILNQVKVDFKIINILENVHKQPFDIIVSNPPYIAKSESDEMRKNVLAFEPHLALFVEDQNPLVFYEAIAQFSIENLTRNGSCFVEINEAFGKETAAVFEEKGFVSVKIHQDIYRKNRFISAEKP